MRNVRNRAFGAAAGFAPLAVLLASIAVGITHPQRPQFSGVGFMIAAALIALVNCYLSFVRPIFFTLRRRRGSPEPYHPVSGLPIIGTLLLSIGALLGFGALGSAIIGVGAFALDTGGSGWFVIATWRDRAFWDDERGA